jgi:hypothetical protein
MRRLGARVSLLGVAVAVTLLIPGQPLGADSSAPLIGAAYTNWGLNGCDTTGTAILTTYGHHGVRKRVRLQLGAMHAAGLDSLRLLIWNSAQGDDQAGVVSSATGRLEEPYRTNLIEFLADVRAAGFDSLTVDFSPQGPNDPIGNPQDDVYDPSLFGQNWSLIKDVRPLVKKYGPTTTRIDLLSEGAPSDYWPFKDRMEQYITEMYRNYADAFGSSDVVVSAIAPPEPGASITQPDGGHRLQNLIDALRASGRPLPAAFSIHVSTWWDPSAANTLYGLRQDDATLTANGLNQPLIVSETVFDDADLAAAIQEFRATSTRPILEVQEWPLQAGSSCANFSVAPPYSADAYIKALTGAAPDTSLAASLGARGRVSLAAPYGRPAVALEAGTYTLRVADHSRTFGFRLTGPGVHIETGQRTTGTSTRTVVLSPGAYTYGRRATHRGHVRTTDQHHLVVF